MEIERCRQTHLALAAIIVLSAALLDGCAGHPVDEHPEQVESQAAPPPEAAAAATPVASAPEAAPTPAPVPAPETTPTTVPADGDNKIAEAAAPPVCQPAATPVPAPKPARPRHKRLHRTPPKQLVTAVQIEDLPKGGVITADVKPFSESVTSILGKKVQGPKGEDLGRIVDVLADTSGRVHAAIIDFGGFLGVGNRRIAVDWPLLRFDPEHPDKTVILSLSRQQLQAAPEYRDAPHPQALVMPSAPADGPH